MQLPKKSQVIARYELVRAHAEKLKSEGKENTDQYEYYLDEMNRLLEIAKLS